MVRHTLLWIFIGISALFLVASAQAKAGEREDQCVAKVQTDMHYVSELAQKICKHHGTECILPEIAINGGNTGKAIISCTPNEFPDPVCKGKIKSAKLAPEYKEFACSFEEVRDHPKDFLRCINKKHSLPELPGEKIEACVEKITPGTPVKPAPPKKSRRAPRAG